MQELISAVFLVPLLSVHFLHNCNSKKYKTEHHAVRYRVKQNRLQWCVRARQQEAGRRNCDPWSSQVPTDLNHVLELTSTLSLPFSSLLFPCPSPCTFSISLCSYLFFISPPPHPLSKPPAPFVSPSARVNLLSLEQIL